MSRASLGFLGLEHDLKTDPTICRDLLQITRKTEYQADYKDQSVVIDKSISLDPIYWIYYQIQVHN